MIIRSLDLKDFTNYREESLTFHPNINLFVGDNAQGKSNLLDSLYFIATLGSGRSHTDRELVRWGEEGFSLSAAFSNRHGDHQLKIRGGKKKEVRIDGYDIQKKKEYIGYLTVILFTPDDLSLIKGDPSLRRAYMDQELAQTDVEAYVLQLRYRKILEQRNTLLKESWRHGFGQDMDAWEDQLVQKGTRILKKRLELLQLLAPLAQETHASISEGEELKVEYQSKTELEPLLEGREEEFMEAYRKILWKKREEDAQRGFTTRGPHRDDLNLTAGGVSLRKFGSQGQQRTAALSLKLAEIGYMKEKTGEYPILLLDDVLSELDRKRKNKLLETIDGRVQTFITGTDLHDLEGGLQDRGKVLTIQEGKVIHGIHL